MPHTRQNGAPDLPELLTVKQFAHRINRNPTWVRRARKMGRIPAAQRVGIQWVYPADALIRPAHVTLDNRLVDIGIPQEFLGGELWYGEEPEYTDFSHRTRSPRSGPRATYIPSLRRLREERELTRYALGRKANIHHTTIMRIEEERTRATPRTILKLANALEVEYVELMREVI